MDIREDLKYPINFDIMDIIDDQYYEKKPTRTKTQKAYYSYSAPSTKK